jgi:hypothetical protein
MQYYLVFYLNDNIILTVYYLHGRYLAFQSNFFLTLHKIKVYWILSKSYKKLG